MACQLSTDVGNEDSDARETQGDRLSCDLNRKVGSVTGSTPQKRGPRRDQTHQYGCADSSSR